MFCAKMVLLLFFFNFLGLIWESSKKKGGASAKGGITNK